MTPRGENDLCQQSHAQYLDKVFILQRFRTTGELPKGLQVHNSYFGDAPDTNFQEAQNLMAELRSTFEELSPEVKAHYADSYDFVNAMNDPARLPEMVSNGVLEEMNAKVALRDKFGAVDAYATIEEYFQMQPTDDVPFDHGEKHPENLTPADTPTGGAESTSEASPK